MLDVFPTEIHGTTPIANPGLIYGAMLFKTFFWRLFLALYGMLLWMLIGTLIGMIIFMLIGTLIGALIGMLTIVQNNTNF